MRDLQPTSSPLHSLKHGDIHAQAAIALLTLLTIATHGFHPLAEDGGLYVAGVDLLLQPSLFPYDRAFVAAHLHYSIFASVLASIVTTAHITLPWLLFICFLFTSWLYLIAIFRLARACFSGDRIAALGASALAAAWFSLPIAGTSVLLMDPYVTARSFSTPLSLLALSFIIEGNGGAPAGAPRRSHLASFALAATTLAVACAFHPLMAGYAAILCLFFLVFAMARIRTRRLVFAGIVIAAVALCATLQCRAAQESFAYRAAVMSRYYWFLSQWQWFELLGIVGPLAIFGIVLHRKSPALSQTAQLMARAAVALTVLSVALCLVFARELLSIHMVARLQPLRTLLPVYAVMIALLGGFATQWAVTANRRRAHMAIPALLLSFAVMFAVMFFVSRASYPNSAQVELSSTDPCNPWTQAFLWIRDHTQPDALIALDARYVNTKGEDAQNFRATALRSELPDYSKDGGEAAITPPLAEAWLAGANAQTNLSLLSDEDRDRRLQSFPVTWIVLHSSAVTQHTCLFNNGVVKVCKLLR